MSEKGKELAKAEPQTEPQALLRLAVESGADVEKLERLMALQERWEATQARKAFLEAMGELQAEMPTIIKTRQVCDRSGRVMYKFASLDQIIAAMQPHEHKHGFTHRWEYDATPEGVLLVSCIVQHAGGHAEKTTVRVPPTKGMNTNAAQDQRVMEQYGKRGSYEGAFGIATAAEDIDAQIDADAPSIDAKQAAEIAALVKSTQTPLARMLAYVSRASGRTVDAIAYIPASMYADVMRTLHARKTGGKRGAQAEQEDLPL